MFQETKINVEHVNESKSRQKLELSLQKLNLKQEKKIKFEIRLRNTIRRK